MPNRMAILKPTRYVIEPDAITASIKRVDSKNIENPRRMPSYDLNSDT